MGTIEIAVDIDDFRLPAKSALRRASELGFRTIELGCAAPEVDPSKLSGSGRRHLLRFTEGLGLSLAALAADFPGLRLTDPRCVEERVDRTAAAMELARELGIRVVTTAPGALTHPETKVPATGVLEALARLGEIADTRGVMLALRPSFDSAEQMARILEELRCPAVRIGLDPAATVMAGVDPLRFVERFGDAIPLVHARDGTVGLAERAGRETPFAEGEVDWVGVVDALRQADYHQPFVLRRTDSAHPITDLQEGRDELLRLLAHG